MKQELRAQLYNKEKKKKPWNNKLMARENGQNIFMS